MHPTAQHARSINGQQSSLDQERNHARAEQLLQRRVIAGARRVCRSTLFLSEVASEFASAHHMKLARAVKQTVRHQRVQVRMKVEILSVGTTYFADSILNVAALSNSRRRMARERSFSSSEEASDRLTVVLFFV